MNIEPFINSTVKSTIVAKEGNYGTNLETTDIELMSKNKKSGKICFGNEYNCLNKNNILSIYTALELNDKMNFVYDSLAKDIRAIEHWNIDTDSNKNVKQYLQDNYYLKDNVYPRSYLQHVYHLRSNDDPNIVPITLLEADELYLQKNRNEEEDHYLTLRNANKRYYPIDKMGDPYLTESEALQLLEPIRKEGQSPHVSISDLEANRTFNRYITNLKVKTTESNRALLNSINQDIIQKRQSRQQSLKELEDKRKIVIPFIQNSKSICDPTKAFEYVNTLNGYNIESKTFIHKIKVLLLHKQNTDSIISTITQAGDKIQQNFEDAQDLANKINTIYFNVFRYLAEIRETNSMTVLTKLEETYKTEKDSCIQHLNKIQQALDSGEIEFNKIKQQYNVLAQASTIHDTTYNQNRIIEEGTNYINSKYIYCYTYLIDSYYQEINKYVKQSVKYITHINEKLDVAAVDPKIKNIHNVLNVFFNYLQERLLLITKTREIAYAEKDIIYRQLQLSKQTTNSVQIIDYIKTADAAFGRYQQALIDSTNYYKEAQEIFQYIQSLLVYIPIRKKWILFNPYRVGFSQGYNLPNSNYSYMTFAPQTTSTWNNNIETVIGLRCSVIDVNPTTASKAIYGIELLNPDGTTYDQNNIGKKNMFYIRIAGGENAGKICKLDIRNRILIASIDPGNFRDYTHYFYFEESYASDWYYLRCIYKDLAMVHRYHFIRPTSLSPRKTTDDAFIWRII